MALLVNASTIADYSGKQRGSSELGSERKMNENIDGGSSNNNNNCIKINNYQSHQLVKRLQDTSDPIKIQLISENVAEDKENGETGSADPGDSEAELDEVEAEEEEEEDESEGRAGADPVSKVIKKANKKVKKKVHKLIHKAGANFHHTVHTVAHG